MMANELKLRRGTDLQHSTFVGAVGEVTVSTDTGTIYVHDGVTPGGKSGGGYTPAGTGAVATTVQEALRRGSVSPLNYGAVGDGAAYDDVAINKAIAHCISSKKFLDLTGASVGWRINKQIAFTGIPGVICSYHSPILVDVTGSYTNGWAVEFGDPSQAWNNGRSGACAIIGHLMVVASSRSVALNGVYMKGSWFNAGHIMVNGFNGCGIRQDSVWDSTFERLYTEFCGNTTTYSLRLDSTGDTHNATHIVSLQCEQAYHKGMYVNVIRDKIDNIHSERLAVLTTNDGSGSPAYVNHYFLFGNSSVNQAVIDCLSSGTAPDGSPLAATTMNVIVNGDHFSFNDVLAAQCNLYVSYGTNANFNDVVCNNFVQRAPAKTTSFQGGEIFGVADVENKVNFTNCSIATFSPFFNGNNLIVNGGSIATLSFPNNILGNISFDNVALQTVGETKEPSSGYKAVTFNDCTISTFNGAYNARAVVNGGLVSTCALASQSKAIFDGTEFGSFSYSGNSGFLTRNCRGPASSTWTVPMSVNYPAGTVTERVGYNTAGKIYQNTDSALSWIKIA